MKAKYFVSVLKILKDKYGFNFNINGSHLAANVVDFLKERDQKKRGDKWVARK